MLVILLGLGLALVSTAPSVDIPRRPTAGDIATARDLLRDISAARTLGTPARLDLDDGQIGAIGLLAGEASGLQRIEAAIDEDLVSARASVPLVGGLWINASATVSGPHIGFPDIRFKVGRISVPVVISRWSINLVRWFLVMRGADLPALDEIVQQFRVADGWVNAELALPRGTGIIERVIGVAGASVNQQLVTETYCRLASARPQETSVQLAALVREAFRGADRSDPVMYNRAAFVALAFHVVGEQAHSLAPAAAIASNNCPAPVAPVLLQGRDDLAKHWAFSAALAAVLGEQRAANIGEWKELHDSLPSGSGFSFVDLAADRSGLHVAREALNPASAGAAARYLQTATEEDLLPEILVRGPEGLEEDQFVDSFGALDETRYREAVRLIDRNLGR